MGPSLRRSSSPCFVSLPSQQWDKELKARPAGDPFVAIALPQRRLKGVLAKQRLLLKQKQAQQAGGTCAPAPLAKS